MTNRSIIRFSLTSLLTVLLAAPLFAQTSRESSPMRETVTREIAGRTVTVERPVLVPANEINFEQYRSDLIEILTAQRETAKMLRLKSGEETIETGLRQAATMKFSDYANVKGFPELGFLKDATLRHKNAIALALSDGSGRLTNYTVPGDAFPGAQYSLNLCPLNPQPPEVAFTSGLLALAATLARDLAHDICLQIVSALVAGQNFSVGCIAVTVVYVAALIIDFPIQFCDEDTTAGEIKGGYLRAEYIKDQLNYSIANDNSNKAMLSTQLTNAENRIVTNDNGNKAALSAQTDAFQAQALRSAIERNMSADTATTAAIGAFQLPASRGGYLELARQILIDTYNAQLSAAGPGVVVYNPATDLAQGATFTAQGKYREAYFYYRKGFRSVVKYP